MHFLESREKLGPQVSPGAACCSLLPEGLGPEAVRVATSLCSCQRQVGRTTRVKEEEGYENQGRGQQQLRGVGSWVAHQEEFWFW